MKFHSFIHWKFTSDDINAPPKKKSVNEIHFMDEI
jgi:hypothetical protein